MRQLQPYVVTAERPQGPLRRYVYSFEEAERAARCLLKGRKTVSVEIATPMGARFALRADPKFNVALEYLAPVS